MNGHRGLAPPVETPLLAAVRGTVARHRLLHSGDRVLVAVSGGPDSTALLDALLLLADGSGVAIAVCHVHHGLRAAADRDAAFVEEQARRAGCPVSVEHVVVDHRPGRSPETAARRARYRALDRAARAFGATRIALGHTADDQAETVLMRLLEGAGPRGLGGIPVRRGRLIRPLLDVGRDLVWEHLAARGLPAVDDETNRDPKLLRNRIRHELLPLLAAQGWPRIADALRRTARASRETVDALDALLVPRLGEIIEPAPRGWIIRLAPLRALAPGAVKAALRLAMLRITTPARLRGGLRAPHLAALHALVDAAPGARVRLPGGAVVERARHALWVEAEPGAAAPPAPIRVPGQTAVPGSAMRLVAEERPGGPERPPGPEREAWFDAAALPPVLAIRPCRAGDRVVPFGGSREVRVQGLLAAAGTARWARRAWPLLVGAGPAHEEILWIIGVRRGHAAPVTADTRTILRLRVASAPEAPPEEELT